MAKYAVVTLMASACEEAPEGLPARCIMDVIECADRDEALQVASQFPGWATPHLICMRPAADVLGETRLSWP